MFRLTGAKANDASLQDSHRAATELIAELDFLHSNHSEVMEAEEEAKAALATEIQAHAQLKVQIKQQRTINEGYHRQIQTLLKEKSNLQSNVSALGELRSAKTDFI